MSQKSDYLSDVISQLDVSLYNVVPLLRAMRQSTSTARDLARAADLYDQMLCDHECGITLSLGAGFATAGLRKIFADMIETNMVDAVVDVGGHLVDQDFFEALGFRHCMAVDRLRAGEDDQTLRELHIARFGDILLDRDEIDLRDATLRKIAEEIPPGTYSARQFVCRIGAHLEGQKSKPVDSVIHTAYRADVPIFCPGLDDRETGLGRFVRRAATSQERCAAIDPANDFCEWARLGSQSPRHGLLAIGTPPDGFAATATAELEDASVACRPYDYAIGILASGSKEAASGWRQAVDPARQKIVVMEPTLAVPLLAAYGYHLAHWLGRTRRDYNRVLDEQKTTR